MGPHDLIRNILFSRETSWFPWNFSHEGVLAFKLELWSETHVCTMTQSKPVNSSRQHLLGWLHWGLPASLIWNPISFPSMTKSGFHATLFWISSKHENTRHSPSVLAYILLFPVFHPFSDLSSCFILTDFAFLIMETCLPYHFEVLLSLHWL